MPNRLRSADLGMAEGAVLLHPEQPAHPDFLQFGHRSLEKIPQYLHVYFVTEVIGADVLKEVRPIVVQLQVVHVRVELEQAAVESGFQIGQILVALVHGAEKVEKVLPARISDPPERRNGAISSVKGFFGQQIAVFAKGDKDNAVQQFLRDMDGFFQGYVLAQNADVR